ncbi:hypothetical protein BgiMline_028081 [Biomphalaria glabrata]|nr:hypothetical protein; partial [Biomphalaria glabrata]
MVVPLEIIPTTFYRWKHRCGDHSDYGHWCPKEQNIAVANKNKLPKYITDAMKPIFEKLTSDVLLQKCLHGGTQNANESFHNLISKRCLENQFVGRKRLEIAVLDATIVYNDGELGRRQILTLLGLQLGYYAETSFRAADKWSDR